MADSKCKKFGTMAWMCCAIAGTELMVIFKFGRGMFVNPIPPLVFYGWMTAIVGFIVWFIIFFFITDSGKKRRKKIFEATIHENEAKEMKEKNKSGSKSTKKNEKERKKPTPKKSSR